MTEQLYQHIQKLVPAFTVSREEIAPFFQNVIYKQDELLLKEGVVCNTIFFVNTGCLYLYYEDKGEKRVIHFALENWWLTDYKTFADAKPAVYAIAAMEDSGITCMSRTNYNALLSAYPLLALYFNQIHERAYGAALFKQKTFATVSKPDFYSHFRNTYPDLIRRIPDPIFASYMGVSLDKLNACRDLFIS